MTITTTGAECGESSPQFQTPRPSRVSSPAMSTYPPAPLDMEFQLLLNKATSEVNQMMKIPAYAHLGEKDRVALHSQLLTQRIDALQKISLAPPQQPARHHNEELLDVLGAQTSALEGCREGIERVFTRPPADELTMDRLGLAGLTIQQQRELREACPTLAGDYAVPVRQDLSLMWDRVERHLRALGMTIEPHRFSQYHIVHLGPVILGETVWQEFSNGSYSTWAEFKEAVNQRYGLSRAELLDAFYDMAPTQGESEAQFILRVERLRIRYAESEATCYRQFKPRLRLQYREELATATRAANLMGNGTIEIDWRTLVRDATSMVKYSSLVPEKATHYVRGLNDQPIQQAVAGVPSVQPVLPPQHSGRRSPRGPAAMTHHNFAVQERHCELCALVGRDNADSHSLSYCYANPQNPEHKPWRARARYRDIVRMRKDMPECMKAFSTEYESKKKEGNQNQASEQEREDIKKTMVTFGEDLQSFCKDGMDFQRALEESYSANFGVELNPGAKEDPVDPCPAFMIMNCEPEEEPDFQAATKNTKQLQKALIRRHLSALNQLDEADLQAALEEEVDMDMERDEDPAGEALDDDPGSDSGSDGSDLPIKERFGRHPIATASSARPTERRPEYTSSGVNTGGVRTAGVRFRSALKKTQQEPTLGRQLAKMRVLIPLFRGLGLKDNLRRYVLAQVCLEAYKRGDTVRLAEGTKVKEISAAQLADEAAVYGDAGIDEEVGAKLRTVRREHRKSESSPRRRRRDDSHLMNELMDSIRSFIGETEEDEWSSTGAEQLQNEMQFMSSKKTDAKKGKPKKAAQHTSHVPKNPHQMPEWASRDAKNFRSLSTPSRAHYTALCEVGGGVANVMLDTAGARSMIDLATAEQLGLPVEKVTASRYFGSFYSASGVPTSYAGRVKGPIQFRFSEKVTISLREMKVIDYPDSLILVGTDLLGVSPIDGYCFAYVGVNPATTVGELLFYDKKEGIYEACELIQWPEAHCIVGATQANPVTTIGERMDGSVDAEMEGDARRGSKPPPPVETEFQKFMALVRNRGQRL